MGKINNNLNSLSKKYYNYMTFRAGIENMEHNLSQDFYKTHLKRECPFFFGVYHDGKNITHDIQNEKADIIFRYRRTQAIVLSRRNLLPEEIDVFWNFFR